MKWEAHQASGFFGLTVDGKHSTPRHQHRVDIHEALDASSDVFDVFATVCDWPDVAPFSGGVWDDWPRKYVQGLSVCKAEMAAIRALHLKESSNV